MLLFLYLWTSVAQIIQVQIDGASSNLTTLQPFQELHVKINLSLNVGPSFNNSLPIVEIFQDEISQQKVGLLGDQLELKIFCFTNVSVVIRFSVTSTFLKYKLFRLKAEGQLSNPSRAVFGTWDQFPILMTYSKLQSYSLPFNMPNPTQNITIDRVDVNIPTIYSKAPYDQSFWINYDTDEVYTVAIPWLPFFAQCENYGNHIYLYDLLEQNSNCTFVDPQNVQVVQTIPTTGFTATGDDCNLQINCAYVEDFTQQYSGTLWWQSAGDILFYFVNQAVSTTDFLANKDDYLGQLFSNLFTTQSDLLVPVQFNTIGVTSQVPGSYELLIKYNQVDQNYKYLYSAQVTGSNYQPIQNTTMNYTLIVKFQSMNYLDLVNGFQFATPIYVALILILGLFTVICIMFMWFMNKLVSRIEHPPKLRLIQTFLTAFIPPIIGCIYSTIPVLIFLLMISEAFESMFNIIGYKSDPNTFTTVQIVVFTYGRTGLMIVITGMILINFGASLLIDLPDEDALKKIKQTVMDKKHDNKADESIEEENEEKITPNERRISASASGRKVSRLLLNQGELKSAAPSEMLQRKFSISESVFSRQQSQVGLPKIHLPLQQVPKQSIFKREIRKIEQPLSPRSDGDLASNNQELIDDVIMQELQPPVSHIPSHVKEQNLMDYPLEQDPVDEKMKQIEQNYERETEDGKEETEEMDEEEIVGTLKSKRTHYQTIQFFTTAFLLVLVGFSYSRLFVMNLFYFIIVLQFVDVIFSWILSKYLLSESLLIQPLMVAMEVIQFVMFLAAESFQDFIVSYIIRIALIIFFRTYITPILKNLEFFSRKLATWAVNRYPQFQPYLRNFVVSSIKDKYTRFYLGTHSDEAVEFQEQQSIEHVITMVLAFSSKMHAIFLKPFILIMIKIFAVQTQIPTLYNIKFSNFDFYIYFAILMIIPQILIDIYVLNSIELIYGYKLYDYFHYCAYRNSIKQQTNVHEGLQLDQSISIEHRSIDNKLFTNNFYFNGSIVVYGILCVMIGVTIIIQNQYRAYEDPVVFFHIPFLLAILNISRFMIGYIFNKFKVSKINKKSKNLESLDEFLSPVKENLESIMEVDIIRKNFITHNKIWIIQNLHLFIGLENFQENDEFLLKTYEYLQNEEYRDQKEKKRADLLYKKQKQEELKSRKKQFQKSIKTSTHEDVGYVMKSKNFDAQLTDPQTQIDNIQQNTTLTNHSNKQELTTQTSEHIIRLYRSQVDRLKNMLFIWFYQGRQNLYLKSLISDILEENLDQSCKRCGLDIEIRVVEQVPFYKMTNSFKYRTLGAPFNKYEWQIFYRRHQKFLTLCLDCEIGYKSKLIQKIQTTSLLDKNVTNKSKTKGNRLSKGIIMKWLFMARSNILFKQD